MSAAVEPRLQARSAKAIRPFFWSVRRELWENKFIFIAPAAVALLVGAYLIGTVHLPGILQSNPRMDQGSEPAPAGLPFSIGSMAVLVTGMLTGAYYSMGALYAERRDRSILFWKSLPLSDRTVVLAKAAIPLAVLPAFIFLVTLVMQLAMLGLSAMVALPQGAGFPAFWAQWPFFQMALVLVYGLVTLVLWHAPIYGWLFLVSAWTRRAPFLWAILPPLAICVAEKVAFNSAVLFSIIVDRIGGSYAAAFNAVGGGVAPISLGQVAPVRFLSTPELWVGLLVAVGLFAAAIRLRRFRGSV